MQEACNVFNIDEGVDIPDNLKSLFGFLANEIYEEIKNSLILSERIKNAGCCVSEKDLKIIKRGIENIKAVLDNYVWLIKKFEKEFFVIDITERISI